MNGFETLWRRVAPQTRFLATAVASTALLAAAPAAGQDTSREPEESTVLMLWGGIRADGELVLEPAFPPTREG